MPFGPASVILVSDSLEVTERRQNSVVGDNKIRGNDRGLSLII